MKEKNTALSAQNESLKTSYERHLKYSLAKDEYSATRHDQYKCLALAIRDRLMERWIQTQQMYYKKDVKRVYYLSLEFLIGRTLGNAIINLGMMNETLTLCKELDLSYQELEEIENDAGLGNGGLGRLAACFLDSMATLELPGYGYGIRYDYGLFYQKIIDGWQMETPDNWLRYGNPWEIERPEFLYPIKFYGRVINKLDEKGNMHFHWIDTQDVMALAYDTPIPGYNNNTVNNMRLWSAKSTRDFNLDYFNHGDYEKAVSDKASSETISKVLYPNDNMFEGKELRLRQEYFFVSATLQDIIRRYKKTYKTDFSKFPDKVAIQLNDTHPAVAIAELMRLLVDKENLLWDDAWKITTGTFGYTNHTVLPEALEKWQVGLLERVLPRHMQIIFEINFRFLESVKKIYPKNDDILRKLSIIEEGAGKSVRMAYLAIVGSHSVNGVAELHTEIIKKDVFDDFFKLWPEKFNNKTNGITQRRWLKLCNPKLSELITSVIGSGWTTDLYELKKLLPWAEKSDFRKKWAEIKKDNKIRLSEYIKQANGIDINSGSLFSCQAKRMHEYKRQLLNVLHIIRLYNLVKNGADIIPRTFIFSGKAAPGYYMAKLIIKLINSVAEIVNNDPKVHGLIKVVFLANYSVSLAEKIMPAVELSEQISTAGTEASGTGNMKFSLNGALTIGTLDGANVEIAEEVGKDNIFIFGLTSDQIIRKKMQGYNPWHYYNSDSELKNVLDMISGGFFSPDAPERFKPLANNLLGNGDYYMLLADFRSYCNSQDEVNRTYKDQTLWNTKSIINVANMGKFSTDRTISQYAKEIWDIKPAKVII